jgi:hypothetical protein
MTKKQYAVCKGDFENYTVTVVEPSFILALDMVVSFGNDNGKYFIKEIVADE